MLKKSIIILVVIVLGVGFYIFTKHPVRENEPVVVENGTEKAANDDSVVNQENVQPDNNWRDYHNDKYSITLKYPNGWNAYITSDAQVGFGENDDYGFNVRITATGDSLNDYLRKADSVIGQNHLPAITVQSSTNLTVAGLPAIQREEFANAPGWTNIVTYIQKGGVIYEFAKVGRYKGSFSDVSTYNQILGSVKFDDLKLKSVDSVVPSGQVLIPKIGDRWSVGSKHAIKWEGFPPDSLLTLVLTPLDGQILPPSGKEHFTLGFITSYEFDELDPVSGSYEWLIPKQVPPGGYVITVTLRGGGSRTVQSERFEIYP